MQRTVAQVLTLLTATVAPAAPLPGQTVVQGGGNALQAAVAAAAVGDVLHVRSGLYDPVTLTRGITVICDSGVEIVAAFPVVRSLTVQAVPRGEVVRWRGGIARRVTGSAFAPWALHTVQGCSGAVVFESLTGGRLQVSNCLQVSLTGCGYGGLQTIVDSTVALTRFTNQPPLCSACDALTITRSSVSVVDATLSVFALAGGSAIALNGGTLTISGPASSIAGSPTGSPAVRTTGGTVRWDPVATLVPGPGAPAISGTAVIVQEPIPTVGTAGADVGQPAQLAIHSEPGSLVFTVAGAITPVTQTPFGPLWIGLPAISIDAGFASAAGSRSASFTVPMFLANDSLTFHAGALLANGTATIGPPASVVYR